MDAPQWSGSRVRGVENGFTLIEVIVALMLMSIVLMAGGAFMIRTVSTSSAVSGRQGAVTVGNEVLEQIRAIRPTLDSTGRSPLVYGRGQAEVTAQWIAAASAGLDISGTYIGNGSTTFDAHTYQTSGTPAVPLQQTISRGGQDYIVDALIGTCVRATAGADCVKLTSGDELFRVVVRVTWTPGEGRDCSGRPCAYGLATLIDPTQDPIFNASRKPVANPDSATVASGSHVDIGVTANDSGDFAIAGSVTLLTSPANGTTSLSNNIVTYTPAVGFSGTNTFTYTVTDTGGRTSNAATVTVTVKPVAVNDVAITSTGVTTVLSVPVLGNDRGTGLSLVLLSGPIMGSAAISASNVAYTAPAAASGVATVTYTAKDSSGQQYTGTLAITVKPTVATAATAATCWPGWLTGGSTRALTLPASAFRGTGPFTVGNQALISGPTGATIVASGTTITYKMPATASPPQLISYTIKEANGVVSDPITMALKGVCP